jgi:hypothetical protein
MGRAADGRVPGTGALLAGLFSAAVSDASDGLGCIAELDQLRGPQRWRPAQGEFPERGLLSS